MRGAAAPEQIECKRKEARFRIVKASPGKARQPDT